MQDEPILVQRAQGGDTEAFAQIYETYFGRVYRYVAIRIGNRLEAEDLTQQVFLNAFQAISSYRWRGLPFAAWIFRIAHNQVVDHHRRQAKRATVPLEEIEPAPGIDPESLAQQKIDIEQLVACTKKLTPAQRQVVSLRFAAGLSTAEVARAMGKSEGAIKALQHSALLALRKSMLRE